MKRIPSLFVLCFAIVLIAAGCGSNVSDKKWALDKKHEPLPDYVLNSSDQIKETYIMAATYPKVLAQVPCYCGCFAQDGHESNLDCFVDQFGSGNAVKEWDSMGIS
ncbi:PCYCGC domain-containing protein [Bacillus sp. FJAT-29953]|uniref:Lipoprotein n=3 Tax=Bacillaceae TaxID=186817 RepID=A0A942YY23_9BACI|nr:hypothetical protein [Neobacillus rhizophilus]MBU8916402.1 PCYCGC domain-containing protein [Bacillus sp. FJAT-29953]